ncbi:NrdH-like glutaredoxin [Arthrobacter phage Crewmate]|uniref:NrdH-like glutaredoxin n=1 Tax=Arthrobacter phage Crewmate TaxID=2832317 RepID=A0AA48Y3N2_9CAUD|nr:thioredoxin domain [Arthrobacter phage Crewmate]UIW13289.1 NrdH-like glutaredoxin [Arthrobacter phage Crewmate]WGH21212.1 NrdH-like glutaredoxin [Arthrobacter phage ObiToo]
MVITLYSRNACQQCTATARKLRKHGLDYVEKNTSYDEAAAQFLRDAGYTQAPVVITSDGREWTGFRPDLIEEIAREEGKL